MVVVDFDREWARELNNKIGSIVPSKFPEIEVTVRPAVMEAIAGLAAHIDRLRAQIPLTAAAANGTLGVEGLVSQDDENCQAIQRAMHKIFDPNPGTIAPDASTPSTRGDKKPSLPDDEGEDVAYFGGFDEIFAKIEEQKRLKQNLPTGEHTAVTSGDDDVHPAPVNAQATPHLLDTEVGHPHQSPPLYPHQDPSIDPPSPKLPNDPGFKPAPPINNADASHLGIPPTTTDIPPDDKDGIARAPHRVVEDYIHGYINYLDMSGNGEAAQGVRQCWNGDNTPITVRADRIDKWLNSAHNSEAIGVQTDRVAGQALKEFHTKSAEAQQQFLNDNHGVVPFNSNTPWELAPDMGREEKILFGNTYQLSTSMHGTIDPATGKYTCQTQTHIYGKFNYGQLDNTVAAPPLQYYITHDSNDLTTNPGMGGMNNMTPGGMTNPSTILEQKNFNNLGKVLAIINKPSPGITITGTSHTKDRPGTIAPIHKK